MKILLANKYFYPRGGDCIHIIGLKQLLEEKGHQVAVFSMQHPENINNDFDKYWVSNIDYSNKTLSRFLTKASRPLFSSEVKKKWNNLLDEFKPDIVHLHNIHTQISPIIAKETYKRNIPLFWTLHDYKLICPAYTLLRNGSPCKKCLTDKKNVIFHRCIKNSLPASLIGYLEAIKWSQKKLEKYATKFITPSFFLKDKMIEAGFSKEKIEQLYNFADDKKFSAQKLKNNYFVYLGRLSPEKGVETLLRVSNQLPYNLKIIGDGAIRYKLEKEYRNAKIEFLGYRNWEEIRNLLSGAMFMVIPSEWYENNPLSIIESLALGTPVLGANIGGIPEMIQPAENGMLFNPGNVTHLKEKIIKMMDYREWDYEKISTLAKQKYNTQIFYNRLLEIYQESVNN